MEYANLTDIDKLVDGTARFTYHDQAYKGTIVSIEYVAFGPGAVCAQLCDVTPVGPPDAAQDDVPQKLSVSCFGATVENRPRELIITLLTEHRGFGCTFSFRVED